MKRWVAVAALAAGVAAAGVLPAGASRAPSRSEQAGVLAAMRHFFCCEASGRRTERVVRIRISTANRRWARVDARLGDLADTGALQLTRAKGWRVRAFGSTQDGVKPWCDYQVPDAVKRDLWHDDACPQSTEP